MNGLQEVKIFFNTDCLDLRNGQEPSRLAQWGGRCFAPLRFICRGQQIIIVDGQDNPLTAERPADKRRRHPLKVVAAVVATALLILPGIVLKGLSYIQRSVRERHALIGQHRRDAQAPRLEENASTEQRVLSHLKEGPFDRRLLNAYDASIDASYRSILREIGPDVMPHLAEQWHAVQELRDYPRYGVEEEAVLGRLEGNLRALHQAACEELALQNPFELNDDMRELHQGAGSLSPSLPTYRILEEAGEKHFVLSLANEEIARAEAIDTLPMVRVPGRWIRLNLPKADDVVYVRAAQFNAMKPKCAAFMNTSEEVTSLYRPTETAKEKVKEFAKLQNLAFDDQSDGIIDGACVNKELGFAFVYDGYGHYKPHMVPVYNEARETLKGGMETILREQNFNSVSQLKDQIKEFIRDYVAPPMQEKSGSATFSMAVKLEIAGKTYALVFHGGDGAVYHREGSSGKVTQVSQKVAGGWEAIGGKETQIIMGLIAVKPGDKMLLCTDGVNGDVSDRAMVTLAQKETAQEVIETLRAGLESGAMLRSGKEYDPHDVRKSDDSTAVVVEF